MDLFALRGQPWRAYTVNTAENNRFDAYDLPQSFPLVRYRAPPSSPVPVVPPRPPWVPYPPFLASQAHPHARPPPAPLPEDVIRSLVYGTKSIVVPSTRIYRAFIHGSSSPPDNIYLYPTRPRQTHTTREFQYAVSFFERPRLQRWLRQPTQTVWVARWKRIIGGLVIVIALVFLGVLKSRPLRRRIAHFLQKFRWFVSRIIAGVRQQTPSAVFAALPPATDTDAAPDKADKTGEQRGPLCDGEDASSSSSEGTTDSEENRSPLHQRQLKDSDRGVCTPETLAHTCAEKRGQPRVELPAIVISSSMPHSKDSFFGGLPSLDTMKLPANSTGSKAERSTEKTAAGHRQVAPGMPKVAESQRQADRDSAAENGEHKHHPRSFFERFPYFIPSSSSDTSEASRSDRGPLGSREQTSSHYRIPGFRKKGSKKALSASASLHEALCDLSLLIQGTEPSSPAEPVNTSIPCCFSFPSLASAMHSTAELDVSRLVEDGPLRDNEREQRDDHVRPSDSAPSFSFSFRDEDHIAHSGKRRRSLAERFPQASAARTASFHGDGKPGTALRWVIASREDQGGLKKQGHAPPFTRKLSETNAGRNKRTSRSSAENRYGSQGVPTPPGRKRPGAASPSTSSSMVSASSTTSCTPPSSSRPSVSQPRASGPPMVSITFLSGVHAPRDRALSSLRAASSQIRKWVETLLDFLPALLRPCGAADGEDNDAKGGAEGHRDATGERDSHGGEPGKEDEQASSQASLTALSGRELAAKKQRASLCQQFLRLLRLALPREKLLSSEGFYLFVLLSTLISRTFLSIWIASVNGRVVEGIIRQDGKKFLRGLSLLVAYALPAALVNAAIQFSEKSLGVLLRKNLTDTLVKKYLSGLTFYQMVALDARVSHPDELLANTTSNFSMLVASLFSSFLKPTVDIVFLTRSILRHLGVKAPLFLGLWYLLTAGVLHWASPPIGRKTARMHELDAKYRALHSDLLHHSEEIAFYGGGKAASRRLERAFETACVYRQHIFFIHHFLMGTLDMLFAKHMSVVMGYAVVALPAFREKIEAFFSRRVSRPEMLDMTDYSQVFVAEEAAKKLGRKRFSEEVERRGVLARIPSRAAQKEDIAHAYVRNSTLLINLAKAVGRIVLAYKEVQQLGGYTERLFQFLQVVEDLQSGVYCPTVALTEDSIDRETHSLASSGRLVTESDLKAVEFRDVAVVTPGGHVLLQHLSFSIQTGKNVFLLGPNGCGKTSLFRILGGLWPLVEGEVRKPKASKLFYIPQRPYMPEGTLRDQVIYPMTYEDFLARATKANDAHLEALLRLVGLGHLLERFAETWEAWRDWNGVLSGGEKQRMAFARLFFHQPVFAILDEATSAVSVDMESTLYRLCREKNITLITISHNLSLLKYHESLLRIFPAVDAGQGPAGQQWTFEPTEGLRRLDSYSFLLNLADRNQPRRRGHASEKRREHRDAAGERGRDRSALVCRVGGLTTGAGEDEKEAREEEGDGAVQGRGRARPERTGDRGSVAAPSKQKHLPQRDHNQTSYHLALDADSSSCSACVAPQLAVNGVQPARFSDSSLSPAETDGPSHTPAVGRTAGEVWSPWGVTESARGRREEAVLERNTLLIEAEVDGGAVVVIQEGFPDVEEEEPLPTCLFPFPLAGARAERSRSADVGNLRPPMQGVLSTPRVASRSKLEEREGEQRGCVVGNSPFHAEKEIEQADRTAGGSQSERSLLADASHSSFMSVDSQEKVDETISPALSSGHSLLVVTAKVADEAASVNGVARADSAAFEGGRSSTERHNALLFPPLFTASPASRFQAERGASSYIRRRHSGPVDGRLPLSAARIGAAAAEATVICLQQAREKQTRIEEGRKQTGQGSH
ncbi:UNVERIFIED_CONTAM: ABC transporter, ATP-binding domain-containing protein [Hammondia hammondi]|eukprot:XP_008883498.1 ABC transporter, ATP-binding domain-containing protein [Hammondia hammondi]